MPHTNVLLRYSAVFAAMGVFIGLCGLRHATIAGSLGALFWLFMAGVTLQSRRSHVNIAATLTACERLSLPRTATITLTPKHLIQSTGTTLTTNHWGYFDTAVLEQGELRLLHEEVVYRRIPIEALDEPELWLAAARKHIKAAVPLATRPQATHEAHWTWDKEQHQAQHLEQREQLDPGSTAAAPLHTRAIWAAMLTGLVWCSLHPPVAAVLSSSALSLPILALCILAVGLPVTAKRLRLEHVNRLLAWIHSTIETPPTPLAAFAGPDGVTWRGPDGDHFVRWTALEKATFTPSFMVLRLDIGQEVWAPLHAFAEPDALERDVTAWVKEAHAEPLPEREVVEKYMGDPLARNNPFAAPEE